MTSLILFGLCSFYLPIYFMFFCLSDYKKKRDFIWLSWEYQEKKNRTQPKSAFNFHWNRVEPVFFSSLLVFLWLCWFACRPRLSWNELTQNLYALVSFFFTWTNKRRLLAKMYDCTSGQRNEAHWTAPLPRPAVHGERILLVFLLRTNNSFAQLVTFFKFIYSS